MNPIIPTINHGESGPHVANVQDVFVLLLDRQVVRPLEPPNRPTREALRTRKRSRGGARAALFDAGTQQLAEYFQMRQGLGDTPAGVIEEGTASKLNERLRLFGVLSEEIQSVVRGRVVGRRRATGSSLLQGSAHRFIH